MAMILNKGDVNSPDWYSGQFRLVFPSATQKTNKQTNKSDFHTVTVILKLLNKTKSPRWVLSRSSSPP